MTEPQPIIEKPFLNDILVVCGRCNGKKTVEVMGSNFECPVCRGTGMLHKVTEGTVKIYLTV